MRPLCAILISSCFGIVVGTPWRQSAADEAPTSIVVTERSADDEAVYRALQTRGAWKFDAMPFADVLKNFRTRLGVNLATDAVALDGAVVPMDVKVSLDLRDAAAETALDFVCRQLGLGWYVKNGVLVLTTSDEIQSILEVRTYDVQSLCPAFDAEGIEQPFDSEVLIELVTSVIAPSSWTDTGGYGGLDAVETRTVRGIVVPQTHEYHEEIEKLLLDLIELKRVADGRLITAPEKLVATREPDSATILRALEAKRDWNVNDGTFGQLFEAIETATGVEVLLDVANVDCLTVDEPVKLGAELKAVTARGALDLVLANKELDWTVYRGVVLVTSPDVAKSLVEARAYDVHDIFHTRSVSGGPIDFDFDTLIALITNSIDSSSWTDVGGQGALQEFQSGEMYALVVSQTPRNYEAIERLLRDLRTLRDRAPQPRVTVPLPAAEPVDGVPSVETTEEALPSAEIDVGSHDAAESERRFAVKLYRRLAADTKENLLVSPYSAFDAMGMVLVGARGQTETELAKALECPELTPEAAAAQFGRLRRALEAHAKLSDAELRIANRLWGPESMQVLPGYLNMLGGEFNASAELLDFGNPDAAADAINRWTSEHTAGRISKIVDAGAVAGSPFILTNALYFKAAWAKPFEKQATRRGRFTTSREKLNTEFMQQKLHCLYGQSDELQFVSLPYKGDRQSMVVLLPARTSSIEKLEQWLEGDRLQSLLSTAKDREVDLRLPRFRFEWASSLKPALSSLGAQQVFNQGADLSGMTATAMQEELLIDDVLQKTFIEVNEAGTEAAAVTVVKGGAGGIGSIEREPAVKFHADRPFLFLIRDDQTGAVLFMGRVVRPERAGSGRGR